MVGVRNQSCLNSSKTLKLNRWLASYFLYFHFWRVWTSLSTNLFLPLPSETSKFLLETVKYRRKCIGYVNLLNRRTKMQNLQRKQKMTKLPPGSTKSKRDQKTKLWNFLSNLQVVSWIILGFPLFCFLIHMLLLSS